MTEKTFLKKLMIKFSIIILIYIAVTVITNLILTNQYSERVYSYVDDSLLAEYEPEDLTIELSNDNIQVDSLTKKGDLFYIQLTPVKKGNTYLEIYDQNNELIYSSDYQVSIFGSITNSSTGNFVGYRIHHLYMIILFLSITILLFDAFRQARKELRYSYHSIFCNGLAIWTSVITFVLFIAYLQNYDMYNTYILLKQSANYFILITIIPLLIFCIALSISNISLIRHEGFRFTNVLGIILSFVIIIGTNLSWFIDNLYPSGSETIARYFNTASAIYAAIYCVLECFLIGAIINGILCAKNNPDYDIDYIVILGCKIKNDGTLYPLIKARVDRAIKFYYDQLKATGKKAIFIPSGGQGSDEVISEGEAMHNYLISQDIPEELIITESKSKNTRENMLFSKQLIEQRTTEYKAAFSTTNYHVFRSGIISRQVDFDVDGMGAKTKWYFYPNAYIREVIGMISYKWKSIILLMIPIIIFLTVIQFTFN